MFPGLSGNGTGTSRAPAKSTPQTSGKPAACFKNLMCIPLFFSHCAILICAPSIQNQVPDPRPVIFRYFPDRAFGVQ
jgi:hypothetical protein